MSKFVGSGKDRYLELTTCVFCDEIYYQGEKVESNSLCECNEPKEPIGRFNWIGEQPD